jgi:hypothetical protein
MSDTALPDQVAALTVALQTLEHRIARGEVPKEVLAQFKSSVDDLRLRLWGLLSAGSADDYRAFQERFRLRRAKEICQGLDSELESGIMSPRYEELGPLAEAASRLASRIREVGGTK